MNFLENCDLKCITRYSGLLNCTISGLKYEGRKKDKCAFLLMIM